MLGKVIRNRRTRLNVTLQELSHEVGITAGGLSQIERGLVDPSLAVLRRISSALKLPMNAMFAAETESYVTRRGERRKAVFSDASVDYEFLSPVFRTSGIYPKVEVVMVTIKPKAYSGDSTNLHDSDECFVVIKGEVIMETEHETITLQETDSMYIKEGIRHRFFNPGDEDAICLSILPGMSF